MKTVTLYNIPLELAADTINGMKDLIIKRIKRDDFKELDDLMWTLRTMQEHYEMAVEKEDEE